jgi:hypothetical protein
VTALFAWVGAMYAVRRENRARSFTETEGAEIAVFTDAFEQNLRMLVKVSLMGRVVSGEAIRRTKEPWDGRLVVRERLHIGGTAAGDPGMVEVDFETHWDRGAGGFRRMKGSFRIVVPGYIDKAFGLSATRRRDGGTGDLIVIRMKGPGFDPRRSIPLRVPKGADLSAGFVTPAPILPVRVGLSWETQTVAMSGTMVPVTVEVVEKGRVLVAGTEVEAYRAVRRVEKDTGQTVDAGTVWYDAAGYPLVNSGIIMGIVEYTLERAERLAASDEEFEKMAMSEGGFDDWSNVAPKKGARE